MSNFVLRRPEFVKFGDADATETTATDLGSVRSVNFEFGGGITLATAAKYNNAPVEGRLDAQTLDITVTCEELTSDLWALLTGVDYDSATDSLTVDGLGGDPVYLQVWIADIMIDGDEHVFHAPKCMVDPSFSLAMGEEQQTVDVPLKVMVDPESESTKFYAIELKSEAAAS
jgi:hypothetical protein